MTEGIAMRLLWKCFSKSLVWQAGFATLTTAMALSTALASSGLVGYVLMSAGMEAAEKTSETVSSGLSISDRSLRLSGNVSAKVDDGALQEIYFAVTSMSSDSPIDFADGGQDANSIRISYMDNYQQIPSAAWTFERILSFNEDDLLDPGEVFQIVVKLPNTITKDSGYRSFTVFVQPPGGALITVERTLPRASRSGFVNLH